MASPMKTASRLLHVGEAWPLGAHLRRGGVNLAVYAPEAEAVWWSLFSPDGKTALETLPLPACTEGVWHGHLSGAGPGLVYGIRTAGSTQGSLALNPAKLLLDPWATEVVGQFAWGDAHTPLSSEDNASLMLKARVPAPVSAAPDTRPRHAWADTVIYELHVKGFSQCNPALPAKLRGTYAGLAHPASVNWLRSMGITSVELLPVQLAIDEAALLERGLCNYWGYNPLAFAVPNPRYAANPAASNREFREMVQSLHAAGIEVILDVVFNHTAEGPAEGPLLSWRGLAPHSYYRHDHADRLVNVTGCGNSLNLAHPRTLQLVMDSLRVWAHDYGVDGFRFDLASTLSRDDEHRFQPDAPFWKALQQDPVLGGLKLIAEPWDAAFDGHGLGSFPAGIREWNDDFRDSMRRFWLRGDISRGTFAHVMAGSAGRFDRPGHNASHSVNYITAHDGFTLSDLVSYRRRHNEDNGENGQDGCLENWSDNAGQEGPVSDPGLLQQRLQRQRSLLACLLLARGVPMLLAGDERQHSQDGNNNAYCHDSALSWLSWSDSQALYTWISSLLALRRETPLLGHDAWLQPEQANWFTAAGHSLKKTDWDAPDQQTLGYTWGEDQGRLCVLVNAGKEVAPFLMPPGQWVMRMDSASGAIQHSAAEAVDPCTALYPVPPGSMVVFTHAASQKDQEE
jgi:isoamylase